MPLIHRILLSHSFYFQNKILNCVTLVGRRRCNWNHAGDVLWALHINPDRESIIVSHTHRVVDQLNIDNILESSGFICRVHSEPPSYKENMSNCVYQEVSYINHSVTCTSGIKYFDETYFNGRKWCFFWNFEYLMIVHMVVGIDAFQIQNSVPLPLD